MVLNMIYEFIISEGIQIKSLILHNYFLPTVVTSYILFVTWIGPAIMESRKPFKLQKTLVMYNFYQVIANAYLVHALSSLMMEHGDKRCLLKKHLHEPALFQTLLMLWWRVFLIRLTDLLDTVFFVLRKKQNQISFLHVTHHAMVCVLLRWGSKDLHRYTGFYVIFAFLINAFIHSVTYFYYGLASLGPSMQKYLWWKKYITILQMVQFVFIFTYVFVAMVTGCEETGPLEITILLFDIFLLLLFWNFYRKYKKD